MTLARAALTLAFVVLGSLASAEAADPHCKTVYLPGLDEVRFQNYDLSPADEANSRGDCVDQIVGILRSRRLPEIAGKAIPAHLAYALTDDEVFPAIKRILDSDPNRFFRVEIKFSIPDDLASPTGEPLTEIEATVRPKP